ncbi:SDR family oxidoreductase [Roseomonas cutis]|uniref:SDR family oxidoreductase n=1 Tax=Roseomonas cutis TaxID=2897332 RepID=UPI00351D3584
MDAPGARTPAPRAAAARPRPPSRAESSSSCRRANHHPTHLSSLFSRYRDTLLGDADRWQELFRTLPFGRPGRPEEIGHAVAFLASPLSGYTSGTILTIDGGA